MEHIIEYEDFFADKGIVLEAAKKDTKVLDKLIDQNLKNSQEMKKVVLQWKKAEGKEKIALTDKLKELTAKKQQMETQINTEVEQLDKGIGLEVVKEAEKNIIEE
jgi:esterase/lipase|tara:strand:- start:440 stop:754 length:315 start_codon:yes stop_codon:yes gene_type:complete